MDQWMNEWAGELLLAMGPGGVYIPLFSYMKLGAHCPVCSEVIGRIRWVMQEL